MSEQPSTRMTRRGFLRLAGAAAGGAVLASCTPRPTPVPPAPTAAPAEATPVPPTAEPTAAPAASPTPAELTIPNWDVYPRADPRHWIIDRIIDPPKKYSDLVLRQNFVTWGATFKEGEDVENNVTTRWIKETTGVTLKAAWSSYDTAGQWATALAAGDIPEFIVTPPPDHYASLLEAGLLEDLTGYWEGVASPLTKELRVYPDALWWTYSRVKGRYYSLPQVGDLYSVDDLLWVRQDWLDKLGLAFPETLDDVYTVGKAFMDAGLAKMGVSASPDFNMWGTLAFVMGAFGYIPSMWRKGEDGRLFYTSTHPSNKEALALLQKWYKDGILETDIVRWQNKPTECMNENVLGNKAGIQPIPFWGGVWPLDGMRTSTPEARWSFGDVPAGPEGKRGRLTWNGCGNVVAFKKGIDPLKIEAVLNQLNFADAIMDASRIGNSISWEGYDYEIDENGKYVAGGYPTAWIKGGGFDPGMVQSPIWQDEAARRYDAVLKADPEGKTWNPIETFYLADPNGSNRQSREAHSRVAATAEIGQSGDYLWTPPSSVSETFAILWPREAEIYTRILMGKDPADAWDKWVAEWKAQGGEQMTADVNDAYEAHLGD